MKSVENRPWPPASCLRLVTVVELISGLSLKIREKLKHEAQIFLDERLSELRLAMGGENLDSKLLDGDVSASIIEEALNWRADLIIVGFQKRTMLEDLPASCVAFKVAKHSPCSVEIVKSPLDWSASYEDLADGKLYRAFS